MSSNPSSIVASPEVAAPGSPERSAKIGWARNPWRKALAAARDTASALFALDLRSLALFRVGLGLILVADVVRRWRLVEPFYSDVGVIPRAVDLDVLHAQNFWSLHLATGAVWGESLLFAAALLFALALLAGWRTRLATLGSWLLLISLHNRNTFIINAGDALLRQLLFWGLFLPLGSRFSIDRALLRGKLRSDEEGDTSVVSVGSAALTLQVVIVYFGSAYLKTSPMWHRDASALYYALSFGYNATAWAGVLLQHPALLAWLTHATLLLEYFGPFLLFVPMGRGPMRCATVAAFTLFHLGIAAAFNIRIFAAICICAWLALLPAWFWERIWPWKAVDWSARFPLPKALRGESLHLRKTVAGTLTATFFFLLISGWIIRGMKIPVLRDWCPSSLDWLCTTLRIDQNWGMFAPSVPSDHGWYVSVATLRSGRVVDILRDGAPVAWEKPKVISDLYDGPEWANYLLYIDSVKFAAYRSYYPAYICRKWNEQHTDPVKSLQLYFMHVQTPPPDTGKLPPAEKILMLTYP